MLAGIIHIEIESASIIKLSVLHAIPAVRLDVRMGSVMFDMARCMARQLCGVILVLHILMSSATRLQARVSRDRAFYASEDGQKLPLQ